MQHVLSQVIASPPDRTETRLFSLQLAAAGPHNDTPAKSSITTVCCAHPQVIASLPDRTETHAFFPLVAAAGFNYRFLRRVRRHDLVHAVHIYQLVRKPPAAAAALAAAIARGAAVPRPVSSQVLTVSLQSEVSDPQSTITLHVEQRDLSQDTNINMHLACHPYPWWGGTPGGVVYPWCANHEGGCSACAARCVTIWHRPCRRTRWWCGIFGWKAVNSPRFQLI